jgi:hypothetical protein
VPWSQGHDQGVHGRDRERDGRRFWQRQSMEVTWPALI